MHYAVSIKIITSAKEKM